jgi:hypothetical protein
MYSIKVHATAATIGIQIAPHVSHSSNLETIFQYVFRSFNSFLILTGIICVILYCLKVKLPLTYRVLSGVQSISILLYSPLLFFYFEGFYVLKLFNLLSGPYELTYRL